MKNIWSIYRHDLRNIRTNYVALIVVLTLMVLPSLYAWFNIYASIDPYANTKNIRVAVVNNDQGATALDRTIHAGDDLARQLEDNDDLGFVLTTQTEAEQGINDGFYFATILIPENFSQNLVSILDEHPQKAQIIYTVNEKVNAITPKITNSGAEAIRTKVTEAFVESADGAIFDVFNQLGFQLGENQDKISQYEDLLFSLDEKMPRIIALADEAADSLDDIEAMTGKANAALPQIEQTVADSLSLLERLSPVLDATSDMLDTIPQAIKDNFSILLSNLYTANAEVIDFLDNPQNIQQAGSHLADVQQQLQKAQVATDNIYGFFESLNTLFGNQFSSQLLTLGEIKSTLDRDITAVDNAINHAQDAEPLLLEVRESLSNNLQQINGFIAEHESDSVDSLISDFAATRTKITTANTTLLQVQELIPDLKSTLEKVESAEELADEELPLIANRLPAMADDLHSATTAILEFRSKYNLADVTDLLLTDSQTAADFFNEPVQIQTVRLFEVANYGTAMTPFYTTLSLWVGGLLLVSLFTTESKTFAATATPREIYFGKLLTFLTIGFFQGLICAVGDLAILGIHAESRSMFILGSIFTSLVFVTVIYSLVSIFGAVGKVLGILLLVLQVAGSGGTFPMELLPTFYQRVQPLFPFRYSLALSREAIAGGTRSVTTHNLWLLLLYFLIALALALLLKPTLNKIIHNFEEKLHHSSLTE